MFMVHGLFFSSVKLTDIFDQKRISFFAVDVSTRPFGAYSDLESESQSCISARFVALSMGIEQQ